MAGDRTTVGEVADVFDGPHATPTKTEDGPYFLSISSLSGGKFDLTQSAHLSEAEFGKWTRRVTPRKGDVLFSYETRLGEAAMMPPNVRACLGRRMGLLRPKLDRVIPEYLLYAYLAPAFQEEIRSRTIPGSTVPRIALKELPDFPIRIPKSLGEQRQVAHILGTLDDKIELNRRMNQTLEAMTQAIFKSWFVDFDPVKAKAAAEAAGKSPAEIGRAGMAAISGKAGAALGKLPEDQRQSLAETAELFPAAFTEAELGEIPEGWRGTVIEDVAERIAMGPFGSRITRSNFVDQGVPVIRGGNLKAGFIDGGFVFLTEGKADELASSNAFAGDIVFTHRGTIGQVGQIPDNPRYTRYVVSQSQMLLRANLEVVPSAYLYQHFVTGLGMKVLLSNASQVGVPAIARPSTSLKAVPIVIPPKELTDRFDELTKPQFDQISQNTDQSRTLSELRDTLLPKLLSGELAVAGFEEQGEETVDQ